MVGGAGEARNSRTFLQSVSHSMYFLPVYLLTTYFFIAVLLPRFLFKKRYTVFAFSFSSLIILTFIAVYCAGLLYLHHTTGKPYYQITFSANKYHALVNGLFVPFMLFGIVAGIKYSKKWVLQQRENERLAKQKLATELQLLKTSIHPRFLFHSLHTVEKHIERSSDESPALILQLSDLLSYILYENDKNWVELEKELEIIRAYINLEEKSLEGKLLLKTEFPKSTNGVFISPCILLSLVESSFEYFLETKQQEPVLTMITGVNGSTLDYQMTFSRPAESDQLPDEKLHSIQRQLLNQYGKLHQLTISSENNGVSINLKLPLYAGELINLKRNTVSDEIPVLA